MLIRNSLSVAVTALLITVFGLASPAPDGQAAEGREIATLIPERCFVYAEAPGLGTILDAGLDHPLLAALLGSAFGQALLSQAEHTPEQILAFGDAVFGQSVLDVLASITARGVALGVALDAKGPRAVLVLQAEDDLLLEETLQTVFRFVEEQVGMPDTLRRPQRRFRDADLWSLGDELVLALDGALLVVSNDEGLLRDVVDLAREPQGRGVTAKESFRECRARGTGDELVWTWTDLAALEERTGGGGTELNELRGLNRRPETQILLGPGLCALGTARTLTAWLSVEGTDVDLGLTGDGVTPAQPLVPAAASDNLPTPEPLFAEDQTAYALIHRDLAAMFAHKLDLFPPETLPAFSQKTSELALFFGGKDLGQEVLPGISPWWRVVVRPLEYDEGRVPEIPLPGVAVVVQVDDADTKGSLLVSAFQTLIGIVNIEQAQQAGQPMVMSLALEGDVPITTARLPRPAPEDGVDMRYNLQPACALVDRSFVLGTHEDLVRELVRELKRVAAGGSGAPGTPVERLELDGAALARVVADNFDTLVMQKVLEDGVSIEEARDEIGGLRLLLDAIEHAWTRVSYPADDRIELRTRIHVTPLERRRQEEAR